MAIDTLRYERQKDFEDMRSSNRVCIRCKNLCKTRNGVVVGTGNIGSDLMLVGEAPGQNEDEQGEPFVGRAGDLLNKMLSELGIARRSVYITNTVKCRPTQDDKGVYNRAPDEVEIKNCKSWLWGEISKIQPKAIVTLGKVATGLLLKKPKMFKMGPLIGVPQKVDYTASQIVPCWHPSYLLQHGRTEIDSAKEAIRIAYDISRA